MSQAKSTGPLLQTHSLKPSTARTSTCPIGHCCICSRCYLPHKYFAIRQLTIAYNKQRMNKLKVAGRVAWKPKIHDDVHLASLLFVYGLLPGNCGHLTDRKIYDQSKIAARVRSSRNPRAARATKLYTRSARIII